jgi:outer membrane receptor for ferrienterochelin and colicins
VFLIILFLCPKSRLVWAADLGHKDLLDMSIEDLMDMEVHGASKFKQSMRDAPASVTIITADEIRKQGYRTLAEILRSVRSFHITYDRNYAYVATRGFGVVGDYNSRILFLVNGHRVNTTIYEAAGIGTDFPVDVDLIERVEIVRGPSFILYGNNAVFGVVNVITKSAAYVNGTEVSGEVASFGTYKGRVTYGNVFDNGLSAITSVSRYTSRGQELYYKEYDAPETNNGVTRHTDSDQYYDIFSSFSFKDFTLEGVLNSRKKRVPTGAYETVFNDRGTHTTDEFGYIDLSCNHEFSTDFSMLGRLFFNRYRYDGDWIYADESGAPYTNREFGYGDTLGGELNFSRKLSDRHRVTVGAEYITDTRLDQGNFDVSPPAVYMHVTKTGYKWGVYGQDEFAMTDKLTLLVGLRYDRYSSVDATTNNRTALIYSPLDRTTLKLLYGTGFRVPNQYELYYNDNYSTKQNPNLRTEKVKSYEFVCEQMVGRKGRITVDAYAHDLSNIITQVIDPNDGMLVFSNANEARLRGIEVEYENKWGAGYEARLSYAYQEALTHSVPTIPVNFPRDVAKINFTMPLLQQKLFSSFTVQYMHNRETRSAGEAGSFVLADATIFAKEIFRGVEVSASIYNLFDKKYSDPAGAEHAQDRIEQDGRNFRFKITYVF